MPQRAKGFALERQIQHPVGDDLLTRRRRASLRQEREGKRPRDPVARRARDRDGAVSGGHSRKPHRGDAEMDCDTVAFSPDMALTV